LQDAYGQLVRAYQDGERPTEIVERDDDFIQASLGPATYFQPLRSWPAVERRSLRWARGRVLDVGAGAGRVALELQRRGHDVVAVDVSPLALEVARERGVRDARLLAFRDVDRSLGTFDTVVAFGNNFGLFESSATARRLLRRLASMTSERARILAASNDPTRTDDPEHLAYQRRNRERGRMPGQLRIRVRYRTSATPWFSYLLASPAEMAELAESGGWRARRFLTDEGSYYVGVLEKAPGSAVH
jgi:SAM-dependent methyltransferase